ncbi:MAG: hypothetical protein GY754_13265 [bacterium]|nr:hypothetical protein [bacterium]
MNVLIINSSPRAKSERCRTDLFLNPLVEGMKSEGANVEIAFLNEKEVKPCSGCLSCWSHSQGICRIKDDMTNELLPKFLKSDLVILASPLYFFSVTSTMKAFIDRTFCIGLPFVRVKNGRRYHPPRYDHMPKIVPFSVSGLPEPEVFDQLSSLMQYIYGELFPGMLAAEIYLAGAEYLAVPLYHETMKIVHSALEQGGKELIRSGSISVETMEKIITPVPNPEIMDSVINDMWETCIENKLTPYELQAKGIAPRASSIDSFLAFLRMGFNPEKAANVTASFQFNFNGSMNESCFFNISNGVLSTGKGKTPDPGVTVNTPFDTWLDISSGKADGQKLFMEGKYSIEGDGSLLMSMGNYFS